MSQLSDELTTLAQSLIVEFGEAVTFIRETSEGGLNPETGEVFPAETMSYSAYAVPEDYNDDEVDGTNIMKGDRKLTIHKTNTVPLVGDTVVLRGLEYRVNFVYTVPMSGNDIIYQLQVRV